VSEENSHEPEAKKGLGDVIFFIMERPSKLFLVAGLLFVCTVFLLLFLAIFKWMFGIGNAEWQLSAKGPEIYFQSRSGEKRYQFTVQPQGWQRTSLNLKKGDVLTFRAMGKVNIDTGNLINKQQKRLNLEVEIAKRFHIDLHSSDVPENHYSEAQLNDLKLERAWNEPDGLVDIYKPAFGGREKKRLLPGAPVGSLLGIVTSKTSDKGPEDFSAIFKIGSSLPSYTVQNDGELWFVVNDITGPASYPDLFYIDNIGFFQVMVTVASEHPWWHILH
jgi:hypothetical protein